MAGDEYLSGILTKYAVNTAAAQSAGDAIYPILQQWGNGYLNNAEWSGSIAKGTSVRIGTDADIFLSVLPNTPGTLADMYNSLCNAVTEAGYAGQRQNVSIEVVVRGYSIDLVPARQQGNGSNYHSLYWSKDGSWRQTNIAVHIQYVIRSKLQEEIKIVKIWRQLHGLSFPSFYLEMAVIDALSNARPGRLEANVLVALEHLRDNIRRARYVDPANSNNVISDDCTAAEKQAIADQAAHSRSQHSWENIVW